MKIRVVKAAAYAVIGYQTAYLMHYYPVEMTAAMLNSVMGNSDKIAYYINFAERQGIQVLPPDINESYSRFTVSKDSIRFGVAAIKNVGVNVVESLVWSKPFETTIVLLSIGIYIELILLYVINGLSPK